MFGSAASAHRQLDITRRLRRMPDPLGRLAVIPGPGEEDVRHEGLRVAVVERAQGRLLPHHQAVTRLDGVVGVGQVISAERRVGKECVRTWSSWWSPYP